jgi:hypothetical protein
MSHRVLAALAILALVPTVTLQACTMEEDCYDCGPCGFQGGPNPADVLEAYNVGADADGVAVVEISLLKEGECGMQGAGHFWLRWDAGSISVVEAPFDEAIDTSMVEYENGRYTWKDRDLAVSYEGMGLGAELTFTFRFDFDVTRVVKCSIAGESIDCQ